MAESLQNQVNSHLTDPDPNTSFYNNNEEDFSGRLPQPPEHNGPSESASETRPSVTSEAVATLGTYLNQSGLHVEVRPLQLTTGALLEIAFESDSTTSESESEGVINADWEPESESESEPIASGSFSSAAERNEFPGTESGRDLGTTSSHQDEEGEVIQNTAGSHLQVASEIPLDPSRQESQLFLHVGQGSNSDSSIPSFGGFTSEDSDDGDLPVECIIAEYTKKANTWYLTKWQGSPLLQSSWESASRFSKDPGILKAWAAKKESIAEGKSLAVDLELFSQKVWRLEHALRERRRLRTFREQVQKVKRGISKTT